MDQLSILTPTATGSRRSFAFLTNKQLRWLHWSRLLLLFALIIGIGWLATTYSPKLHSEAASNIYSEAYSSNKLPALPFSEFHARREKLNSQIKDGIVVLFGARDAGDLGVEAKFHQNENFIYLSGVEVPQSALILIPQGYQGVHEILFIPDRNMMEEAWTGPQPGPGNDSEKQFDFERVLSTEKFQSTLKDILASDAVKQAGDNVYTIVPYGNNPNLAREREFVDQLQKNNPPVKVKPVIDLLVNMRVVKSAGEIEMMQHAIDITLQAQRDIASAAKPGMFEFELEGIALGDFYRGGAQQSAYPCIVGSGVNSTILHYERNRKQIDDNDMIVVDVGAEYNYYAADITRTFPANGHFSKRQREIYQLVLDTQTAAAESFKPGKTSIAELNYTAREVMKNSPLRDSQNRTLDSDFIHGLSHYVGLNVHDVGDTGQPLPIGSVLTIEPGIYLRDEKIGVRIEDDYLVTDHGLVKLSAKLPSTVDEIERLMKSHK